MSATPIPDLKQPPDDAEPQPSIMMDTEPVYASGYPDGWRAMDDHCYRFVVHGGLWYPQNWPETVLRRRGEEH